MLGQLDGVVRPTVTGFFPTFGTGTRRRLSSSLTATSSPKVTGNSLGGSVTGEEEVFPAFSSLGNTSVLLLLQIVKLDS